MKSDDRLATFAFDELDMAIAAARAANSATVKISRAAAVFIAGIREPRPIDDWHEELGPALWWKFPVVEPPYSGTPNDLGQTIEVSVDDGVNLAKRSFDVGPFPSYVTHFTPILVPKNPGPMPPPAAGRPPAAWRPCARPSSWRAINSSANAALHDAKGTEEGRQKAEANRVQVRAITEALGDG